MSTSWVQLIQFNYFNSILFAIKILRFEVRIEKVIAKWETAAKRYTLLHAQRQLCVVAVPLK